ncbi:PadR family transcriptional regulator [Homoserinimonas aerilata]|uniref:PadR family transcriptional regulator n=1 Tax=Homoserinimonas aerilata TaxID=1162970 RepID=A0A542YA69_9MICO|nr:helix-turn-helix transcriptional regulator [Homoserinimonas aerilata]TQL44998.1 PadR family transcriptional regulator [Homoserinimonas aerilata]
MSLRYALLALLSVEPMTGYDLLKQFEASVGYVWHAPDSQIYPALRQMEKDGLLEGEEVTWGQRGKKRRYRITPLGLTAFRQWMNTPLEYSRERDPAHLKAAYLEWAEPDAARAQMTAHLEHYAERLLQWQLKVEEIENGTSEMLVKRLATLPPSERPRATAFKKFTYEGLIGRAQQEIAWARHGLALIDELYPEG